MTNWFPSLICHAEWGKPFPMNECIYGWNWILAHLVLHIWFVITGTKRSKFHLGFCHCTLYIIILSNASICFVLSNSAERFYSIIIIMFIDIHHQQKAIQCGCCSWIMHNNTSTVALRHSSFSDTFSFSFNFQLIYKKWI